MVRNRKTFTETFKRKATIEVLKEKIPINEIVAKHGIAANMGSN